MTNKNLTLEEATKIINPYQFMTGINNFFKDKTLRIANVKHTSKGRVAIKCLIAEDNTDYEKYGLPKGTTNLSQYVYVYSKSKANISDIFAKSLVGNILEFKQNPDLMPQNAGGKLYLYTDDIVLKEFRTRKVIPNEIMYGGL